MNKSLHVMVVFIGGRKWFFGSDGKEIQKHLIKKWFGEKRLVIVELGLFDEPQRYRVVRDAN